MELVFEINFCAEYCKVRFDFSTFEDTTLSLLKNLVKTMGFITANSISSDELNQLLTEEYYPREEMQKLELELWNLTMPDAYIATYTSRFNDLTIFCPRIGYGFHANDLC